MINFCRKNINKLLVFLWVMVVLASIKSIFTDTGFDNAYTVAMSYRHLRGDGMFTQMWEPHQTSIFFTDFFMWLYHLLVPSYTGVMIYLQLVGTLFFAVIGYFIYKLLKDITGGEIAQLAMIFFMMFRAKQTPFPDFANLQIGFAALALLALAQFIMNQEKVSYLCLGAVFLCLEILSYPSTLLTFIPIVLVLFFRTEKKWKNVLIFSATCAVLGLAYVSYFVMRIGLKEFVANISNIFYSDSHSGEAFVSTWNYFSGLGFAFVWLGGCGIVAFTICHILKRKKDFLSIYGVVLLVSEVVMLFAQGITGLDWTCMLYVLPALLMVVSGFSFKKMEETEKTIWLMGTGLGVTAFVATFLLTDLGLITMAAYMVLGGVIAFLPLGKIRENAVIFLLMICMLVTVHRGLVVWGYANKSNVYMVWGLQRVVTSGPSLGVVGDYMTLYQIVADEEDHPKFINRDETYLLVGKWIIDPMEYLLVDGDIANCSVIDTPIYNETLLEYQKLNPDKVPDKIAVSCWYGELMVEADSWVMDWIEDNYEIMGDGRYWRYYVRKN